MQRCRDDWSPNIGVAHTAYDPVCILDTNAEHILPNFGGGKRCSGVDGTLSVRVRRAAPDRNASQANAGNIAALQAAGMALGGDR